MFKLTALLTAKGLAGTSAAVIALGGAATLAAHSGGPPASVPPVGAPAASSSSTSGTIILTTRPTASPGSHGALVTQAVASCKAALTAGEHGIGACVSKVASSNGQAHRGSHAAGHPTPPAHPTPPSHPTPPVTTTPTP
jgi:hypothetical protein